jgi:hypothetical protein
MSHAGRDPGTWSECFNRLRAGLGSLTDVVPLVTATGAGSEMRHAMGVAVFSSMLGAKFRRALARAGVLKDSSRR